MLHWTIQLLGKFVNPTIVAFLVLRYVRNDNKLHFHISLVTQKRGDYTFLLDLVKTMDIQISKLRHRNCEPLHIWTSVFHQIVVFATKSSHIKNFGLGTAERTRENTTDEEDKRKRQIKKRAAVTNAECAKQNTHGNCTPHFLADSFVIKARQTLSDLIGMAIRSTKRPIERFSRVWAILEAGEKTGSLK